MNQEVYRKLISGQSSGLSVTLLRLLLAIAAICYSVAIGLRNFLYSKGWLKTKRVSAIVFSVGNITTGGTGKTPLVIWLCNCLRQQQLPCAVLTRGYKTRRASCGTRPFGFAQDRRAEKIRNTQYAIRNTEIDEPAIIAESCPEARVIVNPNRVTGADEAISKFGAKVLVLDDGFQHRRLARDLDIVTIDAALPFGYDRLLPAGLLREPVTALKRANAAVITRCNQVTEVKLIEIEQKLQRINPNIVIAQSIHAPVCVKFAESKEIAAEQLKNKKIFAFCGIGNPDGFLGTIKELDCELIGSKIYNDHHHYMGGDIAYIHSRAEQLGADLILTTQKDWSSTRNAIRDTQYTIPLAYLKIELKFISGEDKLRDLIKTAVAGKILGM